jgi:hypothetical protein
MISGGTDETAFKIVVRAEKDGRILFNVGTKYHSALIHLTPQTAIALMKEIATAVNGKA